MISRRSYFVFRISLFLLIAYGLGLTAYAQESSDYVNKAWALKGAKNYQETYRVVDGCIAKFSSQADEMALSLSDFPSKGEENRYNIMNDVAACYFIKGEALRDEGKKEESIKAFQAAIDKYPYAQNFDPRGWYWSIKEKAASAIKQSTEGTTEEEAHVVEVQTTLKLYDSGSEFPINYEKYGKFENLNSEDYEYVATDPISLAKAAGEGVYPNTTSIKFDPEYIRIKKNLPKIDHWKVFNSRDLNTAFYKWNIAPEPAGVRQFHIAEILERSGNLKQAVKAYYSILVNFPRSYGWTYWHTPWYVARVAQYRIKHILKNHPELDLELVDTDISIINGYDNNVRNDIFIINPGKLRKASFWNRLLVNKSCCKRKRFQGLPSQSMGDEFKLVKYGSGDWQFLINGKPFMIKAITYGPTRVGESPDDGSLQNWTTQDLNSNNIIDSPYESWVDKNADNAQNKGEIAIGDFQLMKEMGVNSIRLYHQPFELNKEILGQMYSKYGIYIMLGDFLGKYTLGSGADWETGTDYDNPQHRESMLASIRQMVEEFKDEPYVMMWLLGNENVYGLGCNADKKPESFFKFANKAALLIKSLDPKKRPVAIVSGDILYLDVFARNCPDIDVFGTNAYRGRHGFLDIWDEVKKIAEKPAMITEYGAPSYARGYTDSESQQYQAQYHKACWLDIVCNSCGFGAGNAIGGIVFEWLDEWWKAYEPAYHDRKGLFSGPFLDGFMHEEWLGLVGQGNGKNSPYLRQPKKAYDIYKQLWN